MTALNAPISHKSRMYCLVCKLYRELKKNKKTSIAPPTEDWSLLDGWTGAFSTGHGPRFLRGFLSPKKWRLT